MENKTNNRITHDLSKIKKHEYLLGLDEVGWGCIAGELVLGACVVNKGFLIKNNMNEKILNMVRDSKKLSEVKRKEIFDNVNSSEIENLKIVYGRATPAEINELGLALAFDLCIERVLNQVPSEVLILLDGKRVPKSLMKKEVELIIKGDDTSWVIGLASVMAKTLRDEAMAKSHEQYPEYGFGDHKGYGTAKHIQSLKDHGLTPIHRKKACSTVLSK